MDKKIQAQMAENLERKQQGEQFKILDPARPPEKPFKPDRNRILLIGADGVDGGIWSDLVPGILGPVFPFRFGCRGVPGHSGHRHNPEPTRGKKTHSA